MKLPNDPAIPLQHIYPTELKGGSQKDICCFLQHYSQQPRGRSNISNHQLMSGYTKYGIFA